MNEVLWGSQVRADRYIIIIIIIIILWSAALTFSPPPCFFFSLSLNSPSWKTLLFIFDILYIYEHTKTRVY